MREEYDVLEIYEVGKAEPFLRVPSNLQPSEGDLIEVGNVTWQVLKRSFTVDHAFSAKRSMRCNVIVAPAPVNQKS